MPKSLLLAMGLALAGPLTAQTPDTTSDRDLGWAIVGNLGVNLAVSSFNRFISRARNIAENGDTIYWAEITWASVRNNLEQGFEWDDNRFLNNQFLHPLHGSFYYNTARAQGYNYWEAIPATLAGSFVWEYMGETFRPSINDWINTSLGGIALGEMTWRASDLILDNEARGGSRTFREVSAMLVNPIRGLTRLISGDMAAHGPNPPGHRPGFMGAELTSGYRHARTSGAPGTDHAFIGLDVRYGRAYDTNLTKPFDFFSLSLEATTGENPPLTRARVIGWLTGRTLSSRPDAPITLGLFQNFEYTINRSYEIGTQSLGAGLNTRQPLGGNWTAVLGAFGNVSLLSAIKSEYSLERNQDYDYGPGLNGRIEAFLLNRGFPLVIADGSWFWVNTLNGSFDADHYVSRYSVAAQVPILGLNGIGVQGIWFRRRSAYVDDPANTFPDVTMTSGQFRVFLFTLGLSGVTR